MLITDREPEAAEAADAANAAALGLELNANVRGMSDRGGCSFGSTAKAAAIAAPLFSPPPVLSAAAAIGIVTGAESRNRGERTD